MSYHVMTSGRGIGFGALAGAGLMGATSIYSKENLDPPSLQNEMESSAFYYNNEDYPQHSDQSEEEEDDDNKKFIIGASIVGGVVVIAGVAALATRK